MSEEPRGAAETKRATILGSQFWTLTLAVAIALSIRAFVIQPFRIPSGSMFPTLLVGDYLFVNKFVYGPVIPFTKIRLPALREPERGDIVVFSVASHSGKTHPADRAPDLPREDFVKRIVGLPGDRVSFRDSGLHVNGERVSSVSTGEPFEDEYGRRLEVRLASQGDRSYRVLDDPEQPPQGTASWTVEPGRYFMLGDNRDYSRDSRFWGTVRLAEIKGPAFVIYWSWDFEGSALNLLNPVAWWRAEKRWGRVGQLID